MKIETDDINENSDENNIKYDVAYFYNLDSENKICFDCGGAFTCCVSINNGVFLCKFCGDNHRKKLNYNISFIHDINSDWDQYLLSYAIRGGNSRFKRLCLQYEVPCQSLTQNDDEKINKYLIRLGEYNRLVLKSEINCDEPPQPLYKEVAKQPINLNIIYFPEFENYQLFRGNLSINGNNNQINNNNNDASMGSKIWEGTKTTFNIMKNTTGFIYNTGKPIVSFLGNAAFTGLKYVGSSVWNYYMNNENETNSNGGNNNSLNQNNYSNYPNYPINQINEGNNNLKMEYQNPNFNFPNNNNYNYESDNNYNNMNKYNNNIQNKNYLPNSNKYNIYTINDNGNPNNINNNKNNNKIFSKPMKNKPPNLNQNQNQNQNLTNNDTNNIPNYYDINSINNESVNNITFYLNNNNSINMSRLNSDLKKKNSLLNHNNIIVNTKYINDKNFIYNDNKDKDLNLENNMNSKENISMISTSGYSNKLNDSKPNNVYPNFNSFFGNEENNNSNNDILINKEIIDKNVPNIIGEEINQEKARYPIYESANLLDNNSFIPSQAHETNEINKKENES